MNIKCTVISTCEYYNDWILGTTSNVSSERKLQTSLVIIHHYRLKDTILSHCPMSNFKNYKLLKKLLANYD